MTRRELQTTPAICANALAAFTPMEQKMSADAWVAMDAAAAHDLLELVRQMAMPLRASAGRPHDGAAAAEALAAASPWIEQ